MAVYDGFFDAVLDEETQEHDRAYGAVDFTGYFAHIIGSGVCIHNAPDSFMVRFEDGNAVISPGYLFIQGYWLKNDSDYTISVTGTSTLAIVAHLNLGRRMIELEARSVAQAYPDSLVLSLVNPAAGTAEDTRHNTDICGVIDTAGALSQKVEWAVNYIDNEIENKLSAAEADIAEQSKKLDDKIAEVQAQVDKINPPPVGTIQFSASKDVGPEWLLCNGDFISESQYPELVAALGKLTPSGDKFKILSDGEIGPQISNGVLYNGRMWVYSYSTKKLYGVDVEGEQPVKEVELTSENEYFSDFAPPSVAHPIVLSIVPHKIGTGAKMFLSQILSDITFSTGDPLGANQWLSGFLLFEAEFTGEESYLTMEIPFTTIEVGSNYSQSYESLLPFVVSRTNAQDEIYSCTVGTRTSVNGSTYAVSLDWSSSQAKAISLVSFPRKSIFDAQRTRFEKNNGEVVTIGASNDTSLGKVSIKYSVNSGPLNTYKYSGTSYNDSEIKARRSACPVNIIGSDKVLSSFDLDNFPWCSFIEDSAKSVDPNVSLPSAARVFVDAGVYLWGKDIYMIFVGTGLIFSRTLEEGSFGYLDTTSVLGTITQFGYLDYSQDEGTLYLLGQDTSNMVKVAKIVLNTLYDYANNGVWLPMIAADGVPAYIKAYEPKEAKT